MLGPFDGFVASDDVAVAVEEDGAASAVGFEALGQELSPARGALVSVATVGRKVANLLNPRFVTDDALIPTA